MFETLKKAELLRAAEEFGVEVAEGAKKADIILALDTDGVTWEMYQEAFPEDEPEKEEPVNEEPKPVSIPTQEGKTASGQVLIKMVRANPTYQIRGYTFTRRHPFVLVDTESANYLIENAEGFRVASPREAEEYYS